MTFRYVFKTNTPKNKYGNVKTVYNGEKYDSLREANFARSLDQQKSAIGPNKVISWERQPRFILQEGFTDSKGNKHRPIHYVADFRAKYCDGTEKVFDSKGFRTEIFKLKLKLLLYKYPNINFLET